MTPVLVGKGLLLVLTFKNRGHLGSRYTYIYILYICYVLLHICYVCKISLDHPN